jgi:hypothetical protein
MKVKINNKIHDSNDVPMVIILSEQDKANIANLHEDKYRYAAAPTDSFENEAEFREWVLEGTEREKEVDHKNEELTIEDVKNYAKAVKGVQ